MTETRGPDGPVTRTLRVLVALCMHGPQTLGELAERTELAPPTALRFLRLLRDEGFAVQGDDRRWRPTLMTWRLGCAVVDGDGWGALVAETLRGLAADIDETVVHARYEEGWTVYVAMSEPRHDMRTHVTLGARYPAVATITGKCMLAFQHDAEIDRVLAAHAAEGATKRAVTALRAELTSIRSAGAASGEGAIWPGLWGAAAPVVGRDGAATGAIGTTMAAARVPRRPATVVTAVVRAANELSTQ